MVHFTATHMVMARSPVFGSLVLGDAVGYVGHMAVRGFFPDDVDIDVVGKQNRYALVCASLGTAYSQAMETTLSLCLCWDSNASGDSHHDGRGTI